MRFPKLTLQLIAFTAFMFVFGFLLVPLYDVFCDITGLNGKTDDQAYSYNAKDVQVDMSRNIRVNFIALDNENMPWEFYPNTQTIQMHPGEVKQIYYIAKNPTNNSMVAQAIPSVAPYKAASSLKKIECFCFNQQLLNPHEETKMGVLFYLDPDIEKDVKELTLSYTLFDVTNLKS